MRLSRLMNARVEGDAADAIVLAHGFGSDQQVWDPIVPDLLDRMRVVRFDLACSGAAAPEAFELRQHATLDGYADDILDIAAELGVGRFTFVGHSMSAMAGLLASLRHPGRFERLVLIGASPRYLKDESYDSGFERAEMASMFEVIARDFKAWAQNVAPIIVARPPDDRTTRTFLESMRSMRPDIALSTWQTVLNSDFRHVLNRCSVPTAILQTADDPAVPVAAAHYLHAHIPGSSLEILDTAGHLPHLTDPALVLSALRRHVPQLA